MSLGKNAAYPAAELSKKNLMRRRPMHQPSHKSLGGAFAIPEFTPPLRQKKLQRKGEE